MVNQYGIQTDLIEKIRSLAQYLRSKFTRRGLDIICGRLDPNDLPLVRSKLESNDISYSAEDLRYLAKFGQWCDIHNLIASIERPLTTVGSTRRYFRR